VTDVVVVLRKLSLLREHLVRVRRRRAVDFEAFRRDVDLQDATAMSLLVAAQEAVDIAMHIVADEGWGIPSSYGESFDLLAKNGVIDGELAEELVRIVAVRNRIAHGYASVDLQRLWQEIPAGLDCLERYVTAIAAVVDTDQDSDKGDDLS
jgi:uncharacterized protein YutE (UPF0331/DUF86 family)